MAGAQRKQVVALPADCCNASLLWYAFEEYHSIHDNY